MSKYSKEFKEEALKLSDEIGVKKAALQLLIEFFACRITNDTGSMFNLNIYLNSLPRIKHLLIWFGNILWVRWFNSHLPHFAENTIKTGYRARRTSLAEFNPKDN